MTILCNVLFLLLKIIAWILLVLLLLLVVALLLPLGLEIAYRSSEFYLTVHYGPLRFALLPKKSSKPDDVPAEKPQTKAPPPQETQEAVKAESAASEPQQTTQSTVEAAASYQDKAEKPKDENESSKELPFGISRRINAALTLLKDDPMAFAQCALGHLNWFGKALARSLCIRKVTVFWTVTGKDSAETASIYAAEMTAMNNLLAFLQQTLRIQCDSLWLEPDFTGQRKGERYASCRIFTNGLILLWLAVRLLYRVWNDPQLQPVKESTKAV